MNAFTRRTSLYIFDAPEADDVDQLAAAIADAGGQVTAVAENADLGQILYRAAGDDKAMEIAVAAAHSLKLSATIRAGVGVHLRTVGAIAS